MTFVKRGRLIEYMSGGYRVFVSIQEAAEMLGVSGTAVRKLIAAGKLAISGVQHHKIAMIDLASIQDARKHLRKKNKPKG